MPIEVTESGAIMATGPDGVETYRLIALRSGLGLEIKTGMKLSRHRSSSQTITEHYLKPLGIVAENKRPNKRTVYNLFNDLLVANGFEDKPLDA